jgi:membrane protein
MAERLASREMREVFSKFFADRGTHLAAMIAYFALLSFVPLLFLALALLGFGGRADESSFLVRELNKAFPSSSVDGILKVVRSVQDNAATLGVIGAVFVGWTSLSLFSVLESAFNIVYGKPNRSFLHGKLLAVMLLVGSLVALFFGLLIGSVGYEILKRFAGSFFGNDYVAYAASILISTVSVFVFLFAVYYLLTNEKLTFREVLPGAIVSTIVLEASFQLLPIYLHLSKNVIALQAFGAPALLLVWLYLMANVIVFGAEVNWYVARGRRQALELEEAATGLA